MLTGGFGSDQALWKVSSSQVLSESVSIAMARHVEANSMSAYENLVALETSLRVHTAVRCVGGRQ